VAERLSASRSVGRTHLGVSSLKLLARQAVRATTASGFLPRHHLSLASREETPVEKRKRSFCSVPFTFTLASLSWQTIVFIHLIRKRHPK
jgi:hypothetical protein